jgi:hypothetical protein
MLYQVHLAMSGIQNHNFSFSMKIPSGSSNTQIIGDRNWQCRRTNHKLGVKSQLFYAASFLLSKRWPLITSLTVAVKIVSLALNIRWYFHGKTKVVSLNPAHGWVYLIQHYVLMFVSDLLHVSGFLIITLNPFNRTKWRSLCCKNC